MIFIIIVFFLGILLFQCLAVCFQPQWFLLLVSLLSFTPGWMLLQKCCGLLIECSTRYVTLEAYFLLTPQIQLYPFQNVVSWKIPYLWPVRDYRGCGFSTFLSPYLWLLSSSSVCLFLKNMQNCPKHFFLFLPLPTTLGIHLLPHLYPPPHRLSHLPTNQWSGILTSHLWLALLFSMCKFCVLFFVSLLI